MVHGSIVRKNGEVIGEHNGLVNYTIGQRKGLGLSTPEPLYVIGINPAAKCPSCWYSRWIRSGQLDGQTCYLGKAALHRLNPFAPKWRFAINPHPYQLWSNRCPTFACPSPSTPPCVTSHPVKVQWYITAIKCLAVVSSNVQWTNRIHYVMSGLFWGNGNEDFGTHNSLCAVCNIICHTWLQYISYSKWFCAWCSSHTWDSEQRNIFGDLSHFNHRNLGWLLPNCCSYET